MLPATKWHLDVPCQNAAAKDTCKSNCPSSGPTSGLKDTQMEDRQPLPQLHRPAGYHRKPSRAGCRVNCIFHARACHQRPSDTCDTITLQPRTACVKCYCVHGYALHTHRTTQILTSMSGSQTTNRGGPTKAPLHPWDKHTTYWRSLAPCCTYHDKRTYDDRQCGSTPIIGAQRSSRHMQSPSIHTDTAA